MSLPLGSPLDFNQLEAQNVRLQNLGSNPSSPVEGQVYWYSTGHVLRLYNGSGWVSYYVDTTPLNSITAPTGSVSLNSQKITDLADPVSAQDAVTKSYADSLITGLSWKAAVRCATDGPGTLATDFEDGDTVDGVTLATGDRVLIKDQSSGAENGIYVVAASGAPARAADADTASELIGASVFVSEGDANGNSQWVMTTDAPVTVGSTSLVWGQIGASTSYTADETTLHLTGTAFSIKSTYVGQTSITTLGTITTGVWTGTTIAVGNGGTGASDAATARSNLSAAGVYRTTITGDGSTAQFSVTHSLGSRVVSVQVRDPDNSYTQVLVENDTTSTSVARITFGTAPANLKVYHIIVTG